MLFQTYGNMKNPAVLFFSCYGRDRRKQRTGCEIFADRYFQEFPAQFPPFTVPLVKYVSKADEIRQVEDSSASTGRGAAAMAVASSIGADLATVSDADEAARDNAFDGGQFAQIGKQGTRRITTPFLFCHQEPILMKGGTLKKILWCDDDSIKSYFIDAGENLTYTNLRRQISDSLGGWFFVPSRRIAKAYLFRSLAA